MDGHEKIIIGIFGIGLDTYWPQFKGLKERLEGYQQQISQKMLSFGDIELIDAGLVDNPERAKAVGALFRQQQVDFIFLYISTYALSSTVLPIVQVTGVPIIVLNIQPTAFIDYDSFNKITDRGVMTGEWLAYCQACSVPEIANVFNRAGINFHLITGYLGEPQTNALLEEWINAAKVVKIMQNNRLGVIGHYYAGMLDVYTDITQQIASFGGHIDFIEIDELAELRRKVTEDEIYEKRAAFKLTFNVLTDCDAFELDRAARTSVALDKLVANHHLGSLAYYYEGTEGSEHENIVTSIIAGSTMLIGRHIPVAGECEIKNAQAMKILDSFGIGGSFSEFYAMDFNDDIIIFGHDGPAHISIAEGAVDLVPLPVYHGKPGKGLSIQMSVKNGPVTFLSVCEGINGVFLLVAEGQCVSGPVLHIGNTNSRYKFPLPAREFIDVWSRKGPSHHCAIGTGHIGSSLDKLGALLGLPVTRVC
ncbi:MAG: L-fucose/L-arabinose isomerase family protein [Spirochaetia bacterium]|nr:L-fucose/L-arabinose isomerase family protein [Spirochaetia bacterium]